MRSRRASPEHAQDPIQVRLQTQWEMRQSILMGARWRRLVSKSIAPACSDVIQSHSCELLARNRSSRESKAARSSSSEIPILKSQTLYLEVIKSELKSWQLICWNFHCNWLLSSIEPIQTEISVIGNQNSTETVSSTAESIQMSSLSMTKTGKTLLASFPEWGKPDDIDQPRALRRIREAGLLRNECFHWRRSSPLAPHWSPHRFRIEALQE